MLAELDQLLLAGVRREARGRKLHLDRKVVEFFTNALEVPTSGSFICGQAALMSATGLSLDALGVERSKPSPHPASNLLSFTSLNLMLERSSGAGRAFLLRKPFGQSIPATAAFGRKTGMYVLHCYHIPEDDFESGLQLPYGYDVLSCRLAVSWETDLGFAWYEGRVVDYSAATEMHLIHYDDGDAKWHALLAEQMVGTLEWIDQPPYRHTETYDDTTPHYIVYNADTRVLSMYPNILVLEDQDVADPDAFVRRLAGAPYYLHVPADAELLRQVFVKVSEACCVDVPHACSQQLAKHAKAAQASAA